MQNVRKYDYSKVEQLQAFVLFLDEGNLDAVKESYPQYVSFVQANAHRPYQEVKDLCLGLVYTTA